MEAEATVHTTANGIEKDAPSFEPAKEDSIALAKLIEKWEKMVQGKNSVTAQIEAVEQRLQDLKVSKSRTEGAVYALEQLIVEIDPEVLQRMAGG
jgi:Tfp pilus assembly protein PilN